ncbi:ribbon-helix-helix domain-containing protein [Aurantimonas sp. C2-6-R+9]|uniref:ribbon-helix-helix domain-containing protein n=1 Tax=unclassified Aurantimonas TaxID=2638230 RepID=UPI002E19DACC|nr:MULTISPECIES: ribbon-helix-helix domain-containing protein [unclassified Aurantimonas]MEC5291400.1 ribbon-helix-helix domain-containing protein [Aurantimonas sp. C2-3-R2]MEC5323794.1 ribbon-helix-helix domain-containing protein [Aurantimonas sp. A3-2-R12]MEC5381144.1 ribbon-helix-helix domain-containing protein [Aurantimonas sp. C2-6-R+9]MEC5412484.1 ribbon-helix-helix domain-containing protein [Aurantimonas sp. C2-4-R8]
MCQLFAGIPTKNYDSETRSVRLSGHATSIRLEAAFWHVLEELAADQAMPLSKFLTSLHDEVSELHGEARNFTSLLRCACLLHLERMATRRADAETGEIRRPIERHQDFSIAV